MDTYKCFIINKKPFIEYAKNQAMNGFFMFNPGIYRDRELSFTNIK